jgi:hypothetical protein
VTTYNNPNPKQSYRDNDSQYNPQCVICHYTINCKDDIQLPFIDNPNHCICVRCYNQMVSDRETHHTDRANKEAEIIVRMYDNSKG